MGLIPNTARLGLIAVIETQILLLLHHSFLPKVCAKCIFFDKNLLELIKVRRVDIPPNNGFFVSTIGCLLAIDVVQGQRVWFSNQLDGCLPKHEYDNANSRRSFGVRRVFSHHTSARFNSEREFDTIYGDHPTAAEQYIHPLSPFLVVAFFNLPCLYY
jgi:hypothetical protein